MTQGHSGTPRSSGPSSTLKISMRQDGAWTEITLSGELIEDSKLPERIAGLKGPLRINSRDISRANSYGLREWLSAWGALRKAGVKLEFVEIAPILVTTMCVISGFIPKDEIVSVCAPYYCSDCDQEMISIVSRSEITRVQNGQIGLPPCESCGKPTEFQEHKNYFSFKI